MELGLPEDCVTSLADVVAAVCPRASEKANAHIRQQAIERNPILVMIPTSYMLDRSCSLPSRADQIDSHVRGSDGSPVGALLAAPSGFPRMRE